MKDYIEERVLEVAKYIIESKATIRRTAKVFGVSKDFRQAATQLNGVVKNILYTSLQNIYSLFAILLLLTHPQFC